MRTSMRTMMMVLVSGVVGTSVQAATTTEDGPPAEAPGWLEFSGYHRTQYESAHNQFRSGTDGGDQAIFSRTELKLSFQPGSFEATVEVMDVRQFLDDSGSIRNTGNINALEPVQFYIGYQFEQAIEAGDTLFVQAGRFTMDVGSRRLVGRHLFRHAVETFTGINAIWESASGTSVQAFWTVPVERLPSDAQSLADNDIEFDEERSDTHFWGLYATMPDVLPDATLELGLYGLHENDGRRRNFITPTVRLHAAPRVGHWHFDSETAFQVGESRLATTGPDLDHAAFWQRLEVGYTFDIGTGLRVDGLFSYVSGDEDPNDGDNQRFDSLFGVRRPDFGPTGIYGPFARGISSRPACGCRSSPPRIGA